MPSNIFDVGQFEFPYDYRFPGQASDEHILFITRENSSMLLFRRIVVVGVAVIIFLSGWGFGGMLGNYVFPIFGMMTQFLSVLLASIFGVIGFWWVSVLWQKSLCIITTKRLMKYVYTTPINRHILSLPLEQIVDTGAYTKGFLQAFLKLGTFTARSAASSSGVATDDGEGKRINKKYFYIENISIAEDLQHYVSKVLNANRHHLDKISTFRPFIPHLKGEKRANFMVKYPEYWS